MIINVSIASMWLIMIIISRERSLIESNSQWELSPPMIGALVIPSRQRLLLKLRGGDELCASVHCRDPPRPSVPSSGVKAAVSRSESENRGAPIEL